jgi:hypothetical protein
MTIHVLAYPEEEAKRLEKVVLALPIDADGVILDGKPERLPKQISRYLLPQKEDRKSRRWIENAISDFFNDLGTSHRHKSSVTSSSPPRRSSSQSRPRRTVEIHQIKTSPTVANAKPVERERNLYTSTPSVSESSGNDEPVNHTRPSRDPEKFIWTVAFLILLQGSHGRIPRARQKTNVNHLNLGTTELRALRVKTMGLCHGSFDIPRAPFSKGIVAPHPMILAGTNTCHL